MTAKPYYNSFHLLFHFLFNLFLFSKIDSPPTHPTFPMELEISVAYFCCFSMVSHIIKCQLHYWAATESTTKSSHSEYRAAGSTKSAMRNISLRNQRPMSLSTWVANCCASTSLLVPNVCRWPVIALVTRTRRIRPKKDKTNTWPSFGQYSLEAMTVQIFPLEK